MKANLSTDGIKAIGRELVPSEDQNRFVVNLICPVGSNIEYVDEMIRKGENIMAGIKDPVTGEDVFAGFFAATSIRPGTLITEGTLFVRLIPADKRVWTQTEVMNEFAGVVCSGIAVGAVSRSHPAC